MPNSGDTLRQVGPTGNQTDPRIFGAVSAYRGFRRQALFALYRLLELDGDESFQPEGVEDASISRGGVLIEALQVKSLGVELNLSHLNPGRPHSFLRAASDRTREGGRERLRLISFGPLGPELAGLRDGDAKALESVTGKLEAHGLDRGTAESVLTRLEIEQVSEDAVKTTVMDRLGAMLTGVDPDAAFDLLTFWLYMQSERRQTITPSDARDRIQAVGRFLAAVHARHEEWFVTIVPVEDLEISPQQRATLEAEFFQGVSVRYEHVAAGLAVDRPDLLLEIDRGFDAEQVVVVHAASGQGKTTLGYQYLSLLPSRWRFRIAAVPDQFHALQMAAALEGHANAVGLPVYVHLDVTPRDTNWPALVRELANNEHIRVLVTIREEDWRRATDLAAIRLREVELTLSETEARAVFSGLQQRFPDAPPTFEEAWARFGLRGPLLEFVYLVTQGQELRERLSDQVRRLRSDGRSSGEVTAFLRLASAVNANEARALARPLAELVGLKDPAFAVGLLEREYLLRVSDDGQLIAALHPIRSKILAELLTDSALEPMGELLVAALPVVDEADLENFLLGALSNPASRLEDLLAAAIRRDLKSWTGFAGIGRALRWRGVAEYAERHRPLIEEVDPDRTGRWTLMLETDIAGAMPGGTRQMWDSLAGSLPNASAARDAALRFQERQAPVSEVFAPLRQWLERAAHPPLPMGSLDWSGFGEMRYFAGRIGLALVPEWFNAAALDTALDVASLDALGDLSLSLMEGSQGDAAADTGRAWLARHRTTITERYRREADVLDVTDDGETISIDFVMGMPPANESAIQASSGDPNSASVVRLELLRRLIPDRAFYAAQGWGHRVPGLDFDGTQKRIPRGSLPPLWLPSLNATFRGYVERWWRPAGWSTYREELAVWRRDSSSNLELLSTSLERFLRGAFASPLDGVTSETWFQAWATRLSADALLPAEAVDPYGFVDESSALAREGSETITAGGLAIQPYLGLIKTWRELARALRNFADQAPRAIALEVALARGGSAQRAVILDKAEEIGIANLPRLSGLNLGAAVKALAPFESAVTAVRLDGGADLVRRERRALTRVFGLWLSFTEKPWRRFSDPSAEITREHQRFLARWVARIADQLSGLTPELDWTVGIHDGSEGGSLLVTVSGSDAIAVFGSQESALRVLHEELIELPDNSRAIVDAWLPSIVLIPLVLGQSLGGEAVSVSTVVAGSPNWTPEWWHLVPREMPRDVASRFPRATSTRLASAEFLASAVASLFGGITHVLDLPTPNGLDALGGELLERHQRTALIAMRELIRGARSALEEVMGALRLVEASAPYVEDLGAVLDQLRATLEAAPFKHEAIVERDVLEAWQPLIEDGVRSATIARLAWATIALSR
jgi:hypothetical protein